MNIIFTPSPKHSDVDFLTDRINQETREYGTAIAFGFFVRDKNQNIIAGANGFVIYGSVYTDQLWVQESERGKGLGRKIMMRIHDHGISQGCEMATIQTMSFQGACSFYKKLGYEEDFKRSGYIDNNHCIFMKKKLSKSDLPSNLEYAKK